MRFLKDYFPILKKHKLTLIEKYNQFGDIWTFVFKTKKKISWKAGQHGIFTLPNAKIKGKWFRAFSISSAPHEGVIMISTRIPPQPSQFKSKLFQLKIGQTANMFGPVGPFYLLDENQDVFIAAGIGITPFRSIIKENTRNNLLLLYSSKDKFLYKKDLDLASNVKINYILNREKLQKELQIAIKKYTDATYYISGPPQMMSDVKKTLLNFGIRRTQIISDSFFGYGKTNIAGYILWWLEMLLFTYFIRSLRLSIKNIRIKTRNQ